MEQEQQGGVVVGVDGSEAGERAVRYAVLEAQRHGEGLTLVHVVPDFVATSPPANIFVELSSCCPRPPAPTKPSTTDERIAHSHR